mmetsp:Transcript_4909/g.2732  ORF Transcript_4909/g.2732 Transcript_4909/m.2732 type:complete len:104 (-) Transcript_4909:369-680(-)
MGQPTMPDTLIDETLQEATKAYNLCVIIQNKMVGKLHRVFNPPMIIKDADEILTRNLRKLIKKKDELLEGAILRWKLNVIMKRRMKKTSSLGEVIKSGRKGMD